jgi:hypothetical protein
MGDPLLVDRARRRRAITTVALSGAISLSLSAAASAAQHTSQMRVVATSPSPAATDVGGMSSIAIHFSAVVSASTPLPTLSPNVAGSWSANGRELVFTPTGAYPPESEISVSIPGGATGVLGVSGAILKSTDVVTFRTKAGSILRAEQLLAELGYLPVTWHARTPIVRTMAEFERAAYVAPHGHFVFLGDPPPSLRALWHPGTPSELLESALGSFDRSEHLIGQNGFSSAVWSTLLRLGRQPGAHRNPVGFTYALVDKNVGNSKPENITIYQDGRVALSSAANTGISASPTANGTFSVYLRFENQIMKGTSPFGGTYADPVSWVAYFHGSQAVHYIARSQYGFPQSFGCVELPWTAAERAYGLLQLGTLVTVEP